MKQWTAMAESLPEEANQGVSGPAVSGIRQKNRQKGPF
jgi:hypothetical protein